MSEPNYLTLPKLLSIASTVLAILVPFVTMGVYLENRFDILNDEVSELKLEVITIKKTINCSLYAIEHNQSTEGCNQNDS